MKGSRLLSFLFFHMITYCSYALLSSQFSKNRNILAGSDKSQVLDRESWISWDASEYRLFNSNRGISSQSDKLAADFFYNEIVPFGSALSLDQFLQHDDIETLISQGLLLFDEVSDIWISLWGCNCKCLSEEEAFLTLCIVRDFARKKSPGISL